MASASSARQKVKLFYFDCLRARAEHLRMMMRYASIPFEDELVAFNDWPSLKNGGKLPHGRGGKTQLPVLQKEDGTMIPETNDIAAYIARLSSVTSSRTNLYPELESARTMFNACNSGPLALAMPLANRASISESKEQLPEWMSTTLPLLQAYEKSLRTIQKSSATTGPFFNGEKPHYGEFGLFHVVDLIRFLDPSTLDTLPMLQAWSVSMSSLHGIKEYLSTRPQACTWQIGMKGSRMYGVDPIEMAQTYFELSNIHDMASIRTHLASDIVYDSSGTGLHHGISAVMDMMSCFHESYKDVHWEITGTRRGEEPLEAIVDFTMKLDANTETITGVETIKLNQVGEIAFIKVRKS
mmetsp:Transcript_7960/g.11897  ORF Transcript_7960/g.11897 Transcript_7960/m.11897 type:complete len:354 (-) Transcript_7960:15-1076(-)